MDKFLNPEVKESELYGKQGDFALGKAISEIEVEAALDEQDKEK